MASQVPSLVWICAEMLARLAFIVPPSEALLWHLEHRRVLPNFTKVNVVLAWPDCLLNTATIRTEPEAADIYHHTGLQQSSGVLWHASHTVEQMKQAQAGSVTHQ